MKEVKSQNIPLTRKQRRSRTKNQNKAIESYIKANQSKMPSPALYDKMKITKKSISLASPDSTKIRDLPVGEVIEYLGMRRNVRWNKLWFLVKAGNGQIGLVNQLELIANTKFYDTITNDQKE